MSERDALNRKYWMVDDFRGLDGLIDDLVGEHDDCLTGPPTGEPRAGDGPPARASRGRTGVGVRLGARLGVRLGVMLECRLRFRLKEYK